MSRKQEIIKTLVDDDINSIFEAKGEYNDEFYLANILTEGFVGYANMTEDELIKEMDERDLWNEEWFKEGV